MPVAKRRRAIPDAICELWRGAPPHSKRGLGSIPRPRARPGGARRSRTDDILLAKQALYQLSYGPIPRNGAKPRRAVGDAVLRLRTPSEPEVLVGPGRLELPTLRLSGVRSNHLSYGPMAATARLKAQARDRVTNSTTRMVEASMTKVERETETAAFRRLVEPQ